MTMGKVISLAPYLKERARLRVVADGEYRTLLVCGVRSTAIGPRQVASVLDALLEARQRGLGYVQQAVGGLVISGDTRGVWIRSATGNWQTSLNRREQNEVIEALKARHLVLCTKEAR